jgi:hypothetical protein
MRKKVSKKLFSQRYTGNMFTGPEVEEKGKGSKVIVK